MANRNSTVLAVVLSAISLTALACGGSPAAGNTATSSTQTSQAPTLNVQTAQLAAAMQGQSYQQQMAASGGTSPYQWTVAAGQLPAGLSLSSSGVIAGTPNAAGAYSLTVAVSDAAQHTASQAYTGSVAADPPASQPTAPAAPAAPAALAIATSAMETGMVGQAFQQTLAATGGTTPYQWAATAGQLAAGLNLSASGVVTGSPTTVGTYSITVSVTDAAQNTVTQAMSGSVVAAAAFDPYGGITSLSCSGPAQSHFYTGQVGNRWFLCTPQGHAFWMTGVYDAQANISSPDYQGVSLQNLVTSKYATGTTTNWTLNWALQTVNRMQKWGFNTLAEYADGWTMPTGVDSDWGTSDGTIPVKLPFVEFESPSVDSLTNVGGYANGPVKDLVSGVKSTTFNGYRSSSPDIWDPNWQQWLTNALAADTWAQAAIHGSHSDYLIGFNIDDEDNLNGFGAGPDFITVANGAPASGYDQPHLGWIILNTAPTQSSNSSLGQTYKDTTVYSKLALANYLSSHYTNIAALNAAWGSQYTTFGSNGGWGTGTGLLDEDGTCPASHGQNCWVPTDSRLLNGATAAMQADMDGFLLVHMQKYFSQVRAVLNAAAPGVLYLGPTSIGTWGSPPRRQVLQAAAQYVDVLSLASIPPDCAACTDLQQRVDFIAQYGGAKPWINWEGYAANADSYMSPYAKAGAELTTQAQRGALYASRLQAMAGALASDGTYHVAGLKWWALYDSNGERTNWGLLTLRDDPYDGSANATAGTDAWGYPTGCVSGFGCEQGNYGDFLGAVAQANAALIQQLATGNE